VPGRRIVRSYVPQPPHRAAILFWVDFTIFVVGIASSWCRNVKKKKKAGLVYLGWAFANRVGSKNNPIPYIQRIPDIFILHQFQPSKYGAYPELSNPVPFPANFSPSFTPFPPLTLFSYAFLLFTPFSGEVFIHFQPRTPICSFSFTQTLFSFLLFTPLLFLDRELVERELAEMIILYWT